MKWNFFPIYSREWKPLAGRGRPLYLDDVAWRAPALDSEEDEPAPRGPKVVLLPEDRSDVAAPRGGRW